MSKQEVILCEELESSLTTAIGNCPHDKLFILTDEHTRKESSAASDVYKRQIWEVAW